MASRRRRRKSIGKVIVDVERRVRRVEKRPGAKRLKTNVVTTEKLGYRAVNTKTIQPDAVTPNEASFGATFVTDTSPDPSYIKEGTMWVSPTDGSSQVYSSDLLQFVTVADTVAQETADSKNSTYYQDNAPTGGTYQVGDMWVDTNDNDKLYTWDGTAWALTQDSASAASAAQTAYNAAIASLQPSASTIVNASNQITAVNTNGITVYSGANASSGARIVMNSAGIAGFDATSTGPSNGATFSISASTGAAVFKGSIQSGSTISGTTITGSSFASTNYAAGSGVGIITSAGSDSINFVNSSNLVASLTAVSGGLIISSAGGASITMTSIGNVSIASATNTLVLNATPRFSQGSGGNTSGGAGTIRNISAALGTPSGGDPGDVWLTYT